MHIEIKWTHLFAAILFAVGVYAVFSTSMVIAGKPDNGCAITDRGCTLYTSEGKEIGLGFDEWGYNYQSHMFNGKYCDAYRNVAWCQIYKDTNLSMKWNDAWLSNRDKNGDGLLDRHEGYSSYIGSGAWLTNHMSGLNEDGTFWNYFVKIVAVPSDATLSGGIWYDVNGKEIGESIWEQFAVIQTVTNDPSTGEHGAQYISPIGPGFGKF